jgi:hypothetical protein
LLLLLLPLLLIQLNLIRAQTMERARLLVLATEMELNNDMAEKISDFAVLAMTVVTPDGQAAPPPPPPG